MALKKNSDRYLNENLEQEGHPENKKSSRNKSKRKALKGSIPNPAKPKKTSTPDPGSLDSDFTNHPSKESSNQTGPGLG